MNGFDWAIVFPVILKWVVLGISLLGLGIYWFISSLTDEECEEMGYQRNIRG